MKKFVLLLSALFLASVSLVRADVTIYRGISRGKGDVSTTEGKRQVHSLYLVVDYETGDAVTITYYREDGHKYYIQGPVTTFSLATCNLPRSKTTTTLSYTNSSTTSATEFNHNLIYLRGTDATFRIEDDSVPVFLNRPRGLKGFALLSRRNTGLGSFLEQVLGLSFQARATIDANNAGNTLDQAVTTLVNDLKAKGYDLPPI